MTFGDRSIQVLLALSGASADIGRDMRDGALAVFKKVNASKQ